MAQRPALMLALVLFGSVHGQQQHQQQPGFGAAKRVVVIGIDGCRADLIGSAVAPTLQRLVAKGASTTSARALLPTLSLPNWSGILTGSSPSETAITWNGWRRSTARSPPVGLPPRTPPASAPWVPNMLEIADATGVDVSAFHDWAPLNRILSPEFVERAVQWGNCTTLGDEWEELAGGPCGTHTAGDADSVAAGHAVCLSCWDSEDAVASAGAVAQITRHGRGQSGRKQLVFLYQGVVDETGHAFGWGGQQQLEAVSAVDRRIAEIISAIESVDPIWEDTTLVLTADHGGVGTGHTRFGNEYLPPPSGDALVPEVLTIPWLVIGAGVVGGTSLDVANRYVSNVDTAPTALHALGVDFPGDWYCELQYICHIFWIFENAEGIPLMNNDFVLTKCHFFCNLRYPRGLPVTEAFTGRLPMRAG